MHLVTRLIKQNVMKGNRAKLNLSTCSASDLQQSNLKFLARRVKSVCAPADRKALMSALLFKILSLPIKRLLSAQASPIAKMRSSASFSN